MSLDEEVVLVWKCLGCSWEIKVPMPGFAGDGYYHYGRNNDRCGPLIAYRAPDFERAKPGALLK